MNFFRIIRHIRCGSGAFLTKERLSNGFSKGHALPQIALDWATTYQFKGRAKDHCGTICAMNLALWLLRNQKPEKESLFHLFYRFIGNGPTLSTRGLRKGFKSAGFPLSRKNVSSYEQLKEAISQEKPVVILLSSHGFHWHWVMAVGWRDFPNGDSYLRIVDNWNPDAEHYYKLPKGAEWISAQSFSLK